MFDAFLMHDNNERHSHIHLSFTSFLFSQLPDSLHEAETELAEAQQNELKANQQVC